jgi:hypothetical protein
VVPEECIGALPGSDAGSTGSYDTRNLPDTGPRLTLPMLRRLMTPMVFTLTLPTSLAAQLVVRVEARGVPLSGAEVVAWSESARLASARSDGLGNARLSVDRAHATNAFVTARRMGFVAIRVPLPASDSLTLVLTEVASRLPVLAVQSRTLRCPIASDTAAERLWSATAARYGRGQDTLFFGFTGTSIQERVAAEERGYGNDTGRARVGGIYPTAGRPILLNSPPSYGAYERHLSILGEYWQWRYTPLQTSAAWHFASATFQAGHSMTVLARTEDAITIGFCPRARSDADIEGELQIGADTTFRAARWQFVVGHDDEDAGGEATFGVARMDAVPYLIAIRGSAWRRADRGHYEQERFEHRGWRLGRTLADIQIDWEARGDRGVAPH